MNQYRGFEIHCSDYLQPQMINKQFRFPKSKKKRIRLKWKKRKNNYRLIKEDKAFIMGSKVFVSRDSYKNIMRANNGHLLGMDPMTPYKLLN